ncbi:hypothetical protein TNCV_1878181 [Trichonephila clavipes]|nr:hypothetical protein TNCV_1878181 [Trichonephila clavipes]
MSTLIVRKRLMEVGRRYKNFPGRAHRFLIERQSLKYLFTGGAYRILALRDNHRNLNIHTQLVGGAQNDLPRREVSVSLAQAQYLGSVCIAT